MKISQHLLKYYNKNLWLIFGKRFLYLVISDLIFVLLILFLEDRYYFKPFIKTGIFFVFLIFNALLVIYYAYLLIKISQKINLNRLRKFGDNLKEESSLKDIYLNYLELRFLGTGFLATAAADQKQHIIEKADFSGYINFKRLRLPLVFLMVFISFYFFIYIIDSYRFNNSLNRVIHYETPFVKPPVCVYELNPQQLIANQFADFEITITAKGDFFAGDLFVTYGNNSFHATRVKGNVFKYVFQKVDRNINFNVRTNYDPEGTGFFLKVIKKPVVTEFRANLDYPAYLGLKSDLFINKYSYVVPAFTKFTFTLSTQFCDSVNFLVPETAGVQYNIISNKSSGFTINVFTGNDLEIKFLLYGSESNVADTLLVTSKAIVDERPGIYAQTLSTDSLFYSRTFNVNVYDDQALNKVDLLIFNKRMNIIDKVSKFVVINGMKSAEFKLQRDFGRYFLKGTDTIYTAFLVFDSNPFRKDSVLSQVFMLSKPVSKNLGLDMSDLADDLTKTSNQSKTLNAMQKADKSAGLKDSLNSDYRTIEQLSKENKLQMDFINSLEQNNKKLNDIANQFEQLQKLDSVDKELLNRKEENLNKLLDEIRKKMEQLEKEGFFKEKKADEAKKVMDLAKMALEQQQNLLKQLDQALKLQSMIDSLDRAKQENNAVLTDPEVRNSDEKTKNQFDKAKSLVNDVKQNFDDLSKKNIDEKATNSADKALEDLKQSLDKDSGNEKSDQEKAGDVDKKMDQAKAELNNMLSSMFKEELELNIEKLKKLIKHANALSFFQEDNFLNFSAVKRQSIINPAVLVNQNSFEKQFVVFKDSLLNFLKTGSVDVQPYIDANNKIDDYKGLIADGLRKRNVSDVEDKQQRTLGVMNQISLMLSENLEDFSRMKSPSSGGMCSNPKKKKKGKSGMKLSNLTKMQQSVNQGTQKQKEGKQQKSNKDGKSGSEAVARLAAEQYEIRKALQEMQGEAGDKTLKELLKQTASDMEKVEKDLVNNKISPDLLKRQNEIQTRLLEAEKAEKTQEIDNQRKSTEYKELQYEQGQGKLTDKAIFTKENKMFLKPEAIKLRTYYRKFSYTLKNRP